MRSSPRAVLVAAVALVAGCTVVPDASGPSAASPAAVPSMKPSRPASASPSSAPTAGPTPAPGAAPPTAAAATPATEIMAQGTSFSPAEAAVPAGATVAWRNALPIRHTVTAGTREAPMPERFDRELVDPEQVVTATVTQTTPYFCRIHAGMRGTITVSG